MIESSHHWESIKRRELITSLRLQRNIAIAAAAVSWLLLLVFLLGLGVP